MWRREAMCRMFFTDNFKKHLKLKNREHDDGMTWARSPKRARTGPQQTKPLHRSGNNVELKRAMAWRKRRDQGKIILGRGENE